MSSQLATLSHPLAASDSELLPASSWARVVGVEPRTFRLRGIPDSGVGPGPAGAWARLYKYADLPEDYRLRAEEKRERLGVASYGALLDVAACERRAWTPPKKLTELPAASQAKARRMREVLAVWYGQLELGATKAEAAQRAAAKHFEHFGRLISYKQLTRLEAKIDERGGFEFAPIEAYADAKSVPHLAARKTNKIPRELIDAFRALTTTTEHISGAHRALEIAWLCGEPVPGLGVRQAEEPFPYTCRQLRDFAASTAARRMGSHGKARARREALPHVVASTANLRLAETYLLDDTRLDIIALDDLTGRPVELKSYWMIDLATRRIVGYLIREAGAIKATDVDALVARVLRSSGFAAQGSGYKTTIKFERGTVACSPARETFLRSLFPGRLDISRTGIDGGKNHPGDFAQDGSGHWMGKGHIESLMRTVGFFLEHLPGQRGGDYRRQPAALGLKGRDAEGFLEYNKGSRMHDGALLAYAERAIDYIEDGLAARIAAHETRSVGKLGERIKVRSLLNVSHVAEAVRSMVAYYNARTDHRMEGFARLEYQDAQGRLKWRMESPNERAAALARTCATERLSVQDCAYLVGHQAKPVTVTKQGVTFDLAPYKGLRFWSETSTVCAEIARLSTGSRKYVAVFDPETILQHREGDPLPEIYLLGDTGAGWKPGQPARFLEALPLAVRLDRADPEAKARELEKTKSLERRYARELVSASAPLVAERLAAAKDNAGRLREVVTTVVSAGNIVRADFTLPAEPVAPETRHEQQEVAMPGYLARLAARQAELDAETAE